MPPRNASLETSPEAAPDAAIDLLKILLREPSVVGAEDPFFRVLERELEFRGARVTRYQGLLVAEGDDPESAMVSAHVDRHGLVCTGPGEFQYAAYVVKTQGDLTGDSVSEQTLELIRDRFAGEIVHAYEPWTGGYIGQATITRADLCPRRGNLIFELDDLDSLTPGTPLGYLDALGLDDDRPDPRIEGQLDNVLTVAALVYAFEVGFRGRAFFTAEEEAGRSWRYLYEWFARFDRSTQDLFVVDTSPFADEPDADAQDIVLRKRDANGTFAAPTVARLEALCRSQGVRTRYKDELIAERNKLAEAEGRRPASLGRTELGRLVVASEGRINGATLQVPTTGYHTRHESASLRAAGAFLGLLAALGE